MDTFKPLTLDDVELSIKPTMSLPATVTSMDAWQCSPQQVAVRASWEGLSSRATSRCAGEYKSGEDFSRNSPDYGLLKEIALARLNEKARRLFTVFIERQ